MPATYPIRELRLVKVGARTANEFDDGQLAFSLDMDRPNRSSVGDCVCAFVDSPDSEGQKIRKYDDVQPRGGECSRVNARRNSDANHDH